MTKRRSRGEGGLHWDKDRQRWIATVSLGFTPAGKRITRRASGKTKTEVKDALKQILRDAEDGRTAGKKGYTVPDAVEDWLTYGLAGRGAKTIENCRILSDTHIVPSFRRREADALTADEIDEWLAAKAKHLATSTLRKLLSILRRALRRAHARGKVRQNVAFLCEAPTGTEGRPSKSLTLAQAEVLLTAAEDSPLHAYIVVSLLTGPRTEEMRAVTWDHIDLDGDPDADPPRPPSIQVWRSVRADGDTKTRKSRRTLRLPQRCVDTLRRHRNEQAKAREAAGEGWKDMNLVFCTSVGTELDAANVRRGFRAVVKRAGMDPTEWTPRELRHSFVSLLSDAGVAIEDISLLVGHRSTVVTETVYRQQLRPVLTEGAEAMDAVLPARKDLSA